METLDSLLIAYDDATFHDSALLSLDFDFVHATAVFRFDIQCHSTAPGAKVLLRRGTLEFSGLYFYWIEPTLCSTQSKGDSALWITDEGPLPDERLKISETVPGNLPAEVFVHYLYSSSTNSFIVIGATHAAFIWDTAD